MNINLVTFNIKIQSASSLASRIDRIAKRIRTSDADIVCFQEMSTDMQYVAAASLPEYVFIGGGRNSNRCGEGTPIAYKRERFVLQEFRTRWLSATPTVPESTFGGDQSGCPRVYVLAFLTDLKTGGHLRVYNTHFDHKGKNARYSEATLLINEIEKDNEIFETPFVITGDLNAMPHTKEIKLISEREGITDVTNHFEQTFNAYDEPFDYGEEAKIDYIFVSDGIVCKDTELWNEKENGEYLSDHFPIFASLVI